MKSELLLLTQVTYGSFHILCYLLHRQGIILTLLGVYLRREPIETTLFLKEIKMVAEVGFAPTT